MTVITGVSLYLYPLPLCAVTHKHDTHRQWLWVILSAAFNLWLMLLHMYIFSVLLTSINCLWLQWKCYINKSSIIIIIIINKRKMQQNTQNILTKDNRIFNKNTLWYYTILYFTILYTLLKERVNVFLCNKSFFLQSLKLIRVNLTQALVSPELLKNMLALLVPPIILSMVHMRSGLMS